MAIHLRIRDFWPPVQGGWENVAGFTLPVPAAAKMLEELGTKTPASHREELSSFGESDFCNFLDELAIGLSLPPPEQVFHTSRIDRSPTPRTSQTKADEFFAVWSRAAVAASPTLRAQLKMHGASSAVTTRVWRGRRVPDGFLAVVWLVVFIGLALVLRR